MKSNRKKLKISLIVITASLLIGALCSLIFFSVYDSKLMYSFTKTISENDIEYDCSLLVDVCRASEINLSLDCESVEISIPDRLESGTIVEGMGCVSKGEEYFSFSLKGKGLVGISGDKAEEQLEEDKTTYFSVTIKLGENIALADCLLGREKYIYKIGSSDEYICVNVTYEVSPDNKWYYSENGMIFEKDDAGLFESTRFYRVQKLRIDN